MGHNTRDKRDYAGISQSLMDLAMPHRATRDNLADQVAMLRQEIHELRTALCPPKSVILMGPEVERLYGALKAGGKP